VRDAQNPEHTAAHVTKYRKGEPKIITIITPFSFPSYIPKCVTVHGYRAESAIKREVHGSLQTCGSSAMELASYRPPGAQNLEIVPTFPEYL